jgi:peptidyl-prolyl cis-trans isomerase SurA
MSIRSGLLTCLLATAWAVGCLFLATPLEAQTGTTGSQIDKIVAVVDNEIILESEIETQMQLFLAKGGKDDGEQRCKIFENILMSKLLLAKAKLDSLSVTDEQVESELQRRLGALVAEVGSVDNFEKINGRSLLEFRNEIRPKIKDQLLIEAQRNKILGTITITPSEVKRFYNDIPQDSLPYLPAEVEISHIVIIPKPSNEAMASARNMLADLRQKIQAGALTFEEAAKKYSDDFVSARNGGYMGEFGRGDMVSEFEDVAFNLKDGQISEVFQSEYGYHIILLKKRVGDRVEASHILVKPRLNTSDDELAKNKLSSIRQRILIDSLTFGKAARLYSDDKASKDASGLILDPATGNPRIPIDRLPADLFFKIDRMRVGEIGQPEEYLVQENEIKRAWHILWLRNRTLPHRSNLKEDYQKFFQAALQARQNQELEKWFAKAREQVYIELRPNACFQALQLWETKK